MSENPYIKRIRTGLLIAVAANVLAAIFFYIAYNSSKESLFLIGSVANAISAVMVLYLIKRMYRKFGE